HLTFRDPDGLDLALVEAPDDPRAPWTTPTVPPAAAIRGLHGVTLALADPAPTADLLTALMDYRERGADGGLRRLDAPTGAAAPVVDLATVSAGAARLGAGSVHHVAFAVADRAGQEAVRAKLIDAGHQVTPPIDRDYFHAIYFRTPGGVVFEVATEGPGFTVDEPAHRLGGALQLPRQHEHRRAQLERSLPPLA
ncbi:MAG: VOC family protein, partial [Alphaproteobacteria bacterium]